MAMPRIRLSSTSDSFPPAGGGAAAGPLSADAPVAGSSLPPSPQSSPAGGPPTVVNVNVPPPAITFHTPPMPSWAGFPPAPPSPGGGIVTTPAGAGGQPPPLPPAGGLPGTVAPQPAGGATPPPPPAGSPVSAFDRPIPVVVVGPRELIEGRGRRAGSVPPPTKKQKEPAAARRLRNVGKTFDTAGRAGAALGRGSGAGALAVAAEGAAGALAKLGPAGQVAGAAVGAVTAGFKAVGEATDAFVQRARELEQFSGQLAAANAQADIIRMRSDIREARDLEGPLSELAVNQARLESTVSELLRPIKEFVINVLGGLLEAIADVIKSSLSGANEVFSWVGLRSDKIDRILSRLDGGEPVRDLIELWMLDAEFAERGVPFRDHHGDPPEPVAPGLGVPLLMGGL